MWSATLSKKLPLSIVCHMHLCKCCQLDLAVYLIQLLLVLEYMVEKKLEYIRFRNSFITGGCVHIWKYHSWNHMQLSKFYWYFSSYAMLFLEFLKICYLSFFRVPIVNTCYHVCFVIINDINPSRLEFIICIVISNIKIFSWFKLNTFLNIKTTATLNWWSFVPMVVLLVLQFSWFNFIFSFRSPCSRHSYNTDTKFQITNECLKIFKVSIKWTNVGMKQTKIISLV